MRNALVRTAVALAPSSRGRHRRAMPLDTTMSRQLAALLTVAVGAAVVAGVLVGVA